MEEKKETIAKLYALRAGLSILSEMTDNTRDAIDEQEEVEESICLTNDEISELPEKELEEKQNYQSKIDEKYNDILESNREIAKLESIIRDIAQSRWKNIISIFLLFFAGFFPFIVYFFEPVGGEIAFVIIVAGIPSQVGIILNIVGWSKKSIERYKMIIIKSNEQRGLMRAQGLKDKLSSAKNSEYNKIVSRIESENKELNSELSKLKKELVLAKKTVASNMKIFQTAHQKVHDSFNEFLDERDWQNVDLIIYLYETGRAVDLRDALIQVDMEKRNERLVKAVRAATLELAYTIKSGFGELKEMVQSEFSNLNRTLEYSLMELGEQNAEIQKELSNISRIVSSQEALQRKTNESSIQMAGDVAYMKELSRRAYNGV